MCDEDGVILTPPSQVLAPPSDPNLAHSKKTRKVQQSIKFHQEAKNPRGRL